MKLKLNTTRSTSRYIISLIAHPKIYYYHTPHRPPSPTAPQILRPAAETSPTPPPAPPAPATIISVCKSNPDPIPSSPASQQHHQRPPSPNNTPQRRPSLSPSHTDTQAAMAPLPTAEPVEPVERLPMPSRNPLPLSAGQETQVRDLYFARVRALCAAEIKGSFFAPATVTSPELLGQLSSSAGGGRVHLANSGFSQNSQNALSAGHSQRPSRVAPNA